MEYYDRTTDPDEFANTAAELPSDRTARLHDTLLPHGGHDVWMGPARA